MSFSLKKEIEVVILQRKTGVIRLEVGLENRNKALQEINGLGLDYDLWKKLKEYGRRSLVEAFFSRLKLIFGDRLKCKKYTHQSLESLLKIHALNEMARAS